MSTTLAPCLPLQDPDPAARSAALAKARAAYRYDYTTFPQVALSDGLPEGESSPEGWSAEMGRVLLRLLGDLERAEHALRRGEGHPRLDDLAGAARALLHRDWAEVYAEVLHMLQGSIDRGAESVEDYKAFFQSIPAPAIASSLDPAAESSGEADRVFAQQAVAGGNPAMIARLSDPGRYPWLTEALLAAASPGDDLARAAGEARLYAADYAVLEGAPGAALSAAEGGRQKYLAGPVAIYVRPTGGSELRAVAIRLGAGVYAPGGGAAWKIARTFVGVADAHLSAVWFHHARTHLVIGAVALATHRQLAPRHPLHRLLVPHFDGTFYINDLGQRTVFKAGGLIDDLVAASRPAWRGLAVAALQSFDFDGSIPAADFRARGVDDAGGLPVYPYRDDALLVWGCVHRWAEAYVGLYYADDQAVARDNELQGWLREILAADGGGIRGIGEGGKVRTRAYLAQTVAQVIFLASAQHWSMNFPLRTLMTFVPNMPFAAYAPPPSGPDATEADWMATLPPLEMAQKQFAAAYLMGALKVGALGSYPAGWFVSPAEQAALADFQAALQAADQEIDRRNADRYPYIFMKPSELPASINI